MTGLRDELAQAIARVRFNRDGRGYYEAADAVVVLVEQRIADHDKELAAKIKALPVTGATFAWRRVPGSTDLVALDAVLRVVHGDEA